MARKVLVIGSGGREHALAAALAHEISGGGAVFVAPGNAGTDWDAAPHRAGCKNVPLAADDLDGLLRFAREKHIDLTVVGPENPLVAGIVDRFTEAGLTIFGPTQAAARLEASKAFAKDFMRRHGIPTAAYGAFRDFEAARAFVREFGRPVAVKADGLAEGKGVLLCETVEAAEDALRQIMQDRQFGAAGDQVVIEELLRGVEVSALALCDGERFDLMPICRDHKRAFDGDLGPNTGGMGAICPVPDVDAALFRQIETEVIAPVIAGMKAEGTPFKGVLFAGLMLTPDGLRVLEFNCRFGDPETEALMPLFKGNLVEVLIACAEGRLHEMEFHWTADTSAAIVAASGGYPGPYTRGLPIHGLERDTPGSIVYHAGTALQADRVVTARGRVLVVTGWGDDLEEALANAYRRLETIQFEGMFYRRDIGRTVRAK